MSTEIYDDIIVAPVETLTRGDSIQGRHIFKKPALRQRFAENLYDVSDVRRNNKGDVVVCYGIGRCGRTFEAGTLVAYRPSLEKVAAAITEAPPETLTEKLAGMIRRIAN